MNPDSIETHFQWQLAPELLFTPNLLDFGRLARNCKEVREIFVTNLHGPIDHCSITHSEETPWFRLLHVHGMSGYESGCIRIVVEVDTHLLAAGERYCGWLEARIDQVSTCVQLVAQVNADSPPLVKQWRLLRAFGMTLTAAILIGGSLSLLSLARVTALADKVLPALLAQRPQSDLSVLAFAAEGGATITLHTTTFSTSDVAATYHQNLGVAGWSPVWSPDGSQLAFLSDQSGAPQLYTMKATGELPTQLTNSPEPKSAPAWSPDGSQLAFIAGEPGQGRLQIVNSHLFLWGRTAPAFVRSDLLVAMVNSLFSPQNSQGKAVGFTARFAWSPDGRALLLDYYQDKAVRIFQVNADGITMVATDSWSPTWSPDGETIAAVSTDGLFRSALDGSQYQLLNRRQAQTPTWSPDGRWIAFLAPSDTHDNTVRKVFDLWLIEEYGEDETLLSTDCVWFAWSPNGKQLAYVTGDSQAPSPLLYLWSLTPGAKPLLLAEINRPSIAWKPLP